MNDHEGEDLGVVILLVQLKDLALMRVFLGFPVEF